MATIWKYLSYMIPFMLTAIPIFLIVRFFQLKRKNAIINLNFRHEFALLFFVTFIFGLASLTILPDFKITNHGFELISSRVGSINLIPFKVFVITYEKLFINHNFNYFLVNFIGNIVMFMPFGFFPALLWERFTFHKAALTGFLCSFFIESCQVYLPREADIDDVLLNTLGAILGFLIYILVKKFYYAKLAKFKIVKQK